MSMDQRQKDAEGKLKAGQRVQVRVSAEAADGVAEEAHKQRRTIAEMLRVIIEEWDEARRKKKG